MSRLVIDPVTRVGGHLRIEADLGGGQVEDAWSSGTMFRGLEQVLRGHDAREAWLLAERICGTCTGVHALASVRAVEHALGIAIPVNARLVRNVLAATQLVRDHVLSFYQAQLPDWADAQAATTADPQVTSALARSMGGWPQSSTDYFSGIRERLATILGSNQPSPFGPGWWGHPAYGLTPEQNLLLYAHQVEALDWQARLMQVHAILGGKDPHPQTYLVGGMSLAPPWGGPAVRSNLGHPDVPQHNSPDPLGEAGLTMISDLLTEAHTFVTEVFVPDVRMVAAAYPEWTRIGAGTGSYLAFGDYPQSDGADPVLLFPRGRLMSGELRVDSVDPGLVAESVAHAWYRDDGGGELRPPSDGLTDPAFDLDLPLATLQGADRYTWLKAARYDGAPMETGPLARVLVAYAEGRADLGNALAELLRGLSLGPEAMSSVLGRLLARAVESQVVVTRANGWLQELRQHLSTGDLAIADIGSWDRGSWPSEAQGWSAGEGPRGAVGHWVAIRDGVVDRYQVVDATTWNASPRDALGVRGPIETALRGTPVADDAQPIELLRVVHSFNPCLACAAHVFTREGRDPFHLRVRSLETSR